MERGCLSSGPPPRSPGRDGRAQWPAAALGICSLWGGAGAAAPAFAKRLDTTGKGGPGLREAGGQGCSYVLAAHALAP